MTDIVPASTPTSVAVADPEALARKYAGVGMEDIDQTDIVVPRLKIEHAEGKYLDTLSNETFEKLECVVLGVVKQRSLFPAVMDEESHKPPLCKSNDFTYGNPSEEFPWAASKLDPAVLGSSGPLPCASCHLKEWGSHPTTNTPWCAEQHIYVLMTPAGDTWAPMLLTVQKTGIKPSKAYITNYARAKQPMFVAKTRLGLDLNKRGSVKYSIPTFEKLGPTDPDLWDGWAAEFTSIRDYLRMPPMREDAAVATDDDSDSEIPDF